MPELRGTQLVAEVLRISPQAAGLLMTGDLSSLPDVPEGVAVIRKPFSPRELILAVLEANLTAALLGVARGDLSGRRFSSFILSHDQDIYYQLFKTLPKTSAPQTCELRMTRKDAAPIWARLDAVVTRGEGGAPGRRIVISDITERKRANDAMGEALEQLQLITDNMPAAVHRCSRDLRYVWVSPSYAAWLGRASEEIAGRAILDVVGHEFYEAIRPYIERVLSGQRVEYEIQIKYPGAGRRWIHAVYVPTKSWGHTVEGWVGVVADVTKRHEAEEELRRERERLAEARGMERFRLSFEEAPVGMALIRGDGVVLRVNRALCQMTGYTETELISRGRDITHPADRAEESRPLSRILSGELAAGSLEERYLHKQGHTIYVLLSIAAVERDESGQPVHFVAHVQDLTHRKHMEQDLEASRAQMVSSSRLSALGMIAGGIAHEINNPLAVIHASAANISRMAESGSVQIPAVLTNSNRISQTADRISRIVRSLRQVARESSADELRETPVSQIVDEALELCAERFRAHNIHLAVSAIDTAAVISCREPQICQVLLNLLQNAYDELVDWEGERWVTLDVTYSPGWVVLSVSDSGAGISPENRALIMEPFFTTKPVGKGTGLGLSISRSIALEHGARWNWMRNHLIPARLKLPLSDAA
jgi:two-component system NtrC family sensor kinase